MHTEYLHTMTSIYTVCYKKSKSSRLHAVVNIYLYLFDVRDDCFISFYHVCCSWRRIRSEMSRASAAGVKRARDPLAFVMNDSFRPLTVMSLEFCSEALMFAQSVCTAEDSGII